MGYSQKISSAEILSALTTDDTKFAGANIAAIHGQLDFWSLPTTAATAITNTPGDKAFGDVVIPNIPGLTVIEAYALMSVSQVSNSSGASNYTTSVQYIQVNESAAGLINAIRMPISTYEIPAGAIYLPGEVLVGSYDISARADVAKTINFQWTGATALAANLYLVGVRTGVRLIF